MKSKISIFALSFATVCMVSSCLGDNDTEYTYYDDTAITGITLGTLNIYGYKKASDGVTNSLYKKGTVTGGSLTIDQYNRTITNASDSLPVGTDLTKVLFSSITTLNNGIVGIKSLTSDTVSSFSTSDSLDFSKPRDLYVYSSSGQYFRKYTVTIVAHKEYADTFKWSKFDVDNDIKNYKSVKAGIHSNNLIVLGETDNGKELKVLVDGSWKKVKTFSKKASMVSDGNVVCVTDGGNVYTSSDTNLSNWNSASANVKTVLGVCGQELFAMSDENDIMVSLDKGYSWRVDAIDEDAKLLPSSDFNFIASTTTTNADIKRAFLIGNSTADNTNAVVWTKIIEEDSSKDIPWMYQEFKRINKYTLPKMNDLSVIPYADGLIAIGGKYEKMYYSIDCGITWKEDTRFVLPEGFSAETASMAVDANNYIWIVCTGTGQIWRGRLNELGW
jgi:hypothetical protein